MTQIVIDFPDSLFKGAKALAQREKVSIEQLITSALGEKLAALMTEDYLAKRGNREAFMSVWIMRWILGLWQKISFKTTETATPGLRSVRP